MLCGRGGSVLPGGRGMDEVASGSPRTLRTHHVQRHLAWPWAAIPTDAPFRWGLRRAAGRPSLTRSQLSATPFPEWRQSLSLSAGAPFRPAELGSLVAIPAEPGAVPSGGHRAAFWRASMSERLWRFPRTIQIAFFTPHCTMPTLIPIICALAKCTLSDPSPCETLQEESAAPVGC